MNIAVRLDPEHATVRFTIADYLRMDEAGACADMRVELVEGELVKMMPGSLAHGEAKAILAVKLMPLYAGSARLAADLMVKTGPATVRGIDVAVVRALTIA